MYLKELRLWNFRKFGSGNDNLDLLNPDVLIPFQKGINVLIGENDSGKTAIIDAIKLVLKTHSLDWFRVEPDDFFENATRFRMELKFENLSDDEAKNFTEWLGWTGEGEHAVPYLRLIYEAKRNSLNQIIPFDVKAGVESEGYSLTSEAREYLKVTYLKPLRDAESELIPKRNSRLSQILLGHEAFKGKDADHTLVDLFGRFNKAVELYFDGKDEVNNDIADQKGKELKAQIDKFIKAFYNKTRESQFDVSEGKLKNILEKLELSIKDEQNPGLGTLNRLFISSELLHLHKKDWSGLRLGLIEEIEAHLHPQAQMLIIEALQMETDIQLILTTHSPNIGSKLKLNNLIICNEDKVFPMGGDHTLLSPNDYVFLERFLDITKANLFFARGLILVEGWAEEILLPAFAKKLGYNLTEMGVSVINIGGTAFLRYSNIFKRKTTPELNIPLSVVTDLDVTPMEETVVTNGITKKASETTKKEQKYNGQRVKTFVSSQWTLEYCLFKSTSLQSSFKSIVEEVHNGTDWSDFETQLVTKLENKGLDKTEIAYRLAQTLEMDLKLTTPLITIDPTDPSIQYLINAIKYACRV